jgi:outer membrane protein assembly factor BamB
LWKKNNPAPFNSQIKIYKDMFFVTDFNNTLRCFSILDGKELWNYKTDKSLIKSQQKLSIAIQDDKVFFNKSSGDISALSINDGNLLWQRPTQNNLVFENSFLLKNSELVAVKDSILFSNNRNEFYSLDINSGNLRWKQEINSNINPIVINDLIFSVSNDGFLYILRKLDGSILRITNIFDIFKPKKRKKTLTQGFVVTGNKIYLSTNNGYILTIDIESGKTERYIKIDNSKISKPFIVKKFLYVVKDNSNIKLN